MKKSIIAGVVAVVAIAVASTAAAATFTATLKLGSSGSEVKSLQMVLNADPATRVADTGAGSPGSESTYFGAKTKAAVIKFQEKYAADILTPVGLTKGTGLVGPSTRAKLNAMGGSTTGTTTGTGTTTTGGSVTVSSPAQPANGLAIQGSSRVPFTKVTLTAGSSDVVVNGVTVERSGYGVNANFQGVVLLDEDGTQLDIAKTLGSTNQAIIGGTFTVKAGTSKTLTVAGNMTADNSTRAGQVVGLTVVAVNATGAVGSLPITGAMHTINGTLSIGSVAAATSSFDPGTAQSKEIGTTGYKFTAIRLTPSVEDARLKSIRFYQAGSVGSGDLANVMIYVDGTAYPTTVSADGKYYSTNFGSGIVIAKGLSKDLWIAGDIVGSGAAGRSVDFDIYKNTDLYITGETYGQGIIATGTTGIIAMSSTPAVNGYAVSITGGSFTTISKATSVAAQNIAVNVPNQVLGGFETDIKGEAITVQSLQFTVATSSTGVGLLTNVSLYDANGAVVAGPVDTSGAGTTIAFTDSVTFPVGKKVYTLKGQLPSTFTNNGTITVSTTPSSQWTSVTGATTGNTISLSALSSAVTMNQMTVKGGALAIAVSGVPGNQVVTAGSQNFTFSNVQLNTTASGEDVKLASLPLKYTFTGGPANNLTGCQLYDGSTSLNSSNVVNPTAASGSDVTFTLDSALTVAKGTTKSLALKCNIATAATSTTAYSWGLSSSPTITVTGVASGVEITESVTAATGSTMTIGSAAYTIAKDSSSPSRVAVVAGTTGVTLAKIKVTSQNDSLDLQQVALQLTNSASSSPANLVNGNLDVYNGAVKVGSATLSGSTATTTVAYLSGVTVPKDGSVVLTVKADLSPITNNSDASANQGAFIAVDYDNDSQAGSTVAKSSAGSNATNSSTGDTSVDGVRVYSAVPALTRIETGINKTLVAGTSTDLDIYRFSVAANPASGNGVSIGKLTINVATSTASAVSGTTTVTNLKVFAYTDSGFNSQAPGYTAGQVVSTIPTLVSGDNAAVLSTPIAIPAGQTYYFKVTADVVAVTGSNGLSGSVTTKVKGDASYPSLAGKMGTYAQAASGSNFVWSPNATGTSATTHADWTNGVDLPSLSAAGLDTITISK